MDPLKLINKSFGVYNIKGIYFEPSYWMAGTIVLLIFLLIFTIARIRYLYVHWNLGKPSMSMLFWGFFLAFIVEGFLVISGRTLFTEILGWENAPKPISTIIDIGRAKLFGVLGESDEIPSLPTKEIPTHQSVVRDFEGLLSEEKDTVRTFVCKP